MRAERGRAFGVAACRGTPKIGLYWVGRELWMSALRVKLRSEDASWLKLRENYNILRIKSFGTGVFCTCLKIQKIYFMKNM